MDIYQLEYVLHDPTEDHGGMYWAEIPVLRGCNAWGDTPSETLDELWAVARAIIQSLKERGQPLPEEVVPKETRQGSLTITA